MSQHDLISKINLTRNRKLAKFTVAHVKGKLEVDFKQMNNHELCALETVIPVSDPESNICPIIQSFIEQQS